MIHHDLTSLRLFVSVADHENIAKASRENNIAASAISKRIADLEAQIGTPLLNRTKYGVELTPAGTALLRYSKRIVSLLKDLDAELSEFSEGFRGQVRLWANTSAVTQFLPEDLSSYVAKYPNVSVELKEETSRNIVSAIKSGATDVGIFSEHVDYADIGFKIYRRDSLMVVLPRGHVLEARKSIQLEELAQYDLVGLQDGSSLQYKLTKEASLAGRALKHRIKVLGFDGIRRMVEARLGLAVLPEGAIVPYLITGLFSAVPLDEVWATRSLLVGYRDYEGLALVARALVDCLIPDSGVPHLP